MSFSFPSFLLSFCFILLFPNFQYFSFPLLQLYFVDHNSPSFYFTSYFIIYSLFLISLPRHKFASTSAPCPPYLSPACHHHIMSCRSPCPSNEVYLSPPSGPIYHCSLSHQTLGLYHAKPWVSNLVIHTHTGTIAPIC